MNNANLKVNSLVARLSDLSLLPLHRRIYVKSDFTFVALTDLISFIPVSEMSPGVFEPLSCHPPAYRKHRLSTVFDLATRDRYYMDIFPVEASRVQVVSCFIFHFP